MAPAKRDGAAGGGAVGGAPGVCAGGCGVPPVGGTAAGTAGVCDSPSAAGRARSIRFSNDMCCVLPISSAACEESALGGLIGLSGGGSSLAGECSGELGDVPGEGRFRM